ncbi:MAG: hypothetical protein KDF65_03955 [Anaerolineae bacterium]|nr:hypothetical protein [Anaerolineae bacterium]
MVHRFWENSLINQTILAMTAHRRPIVAFFFPGRSNDRALVIGGVHGSELSAIEVVEHLIETLHVGATLPHYNVIVIPHLFPDNAAVAEAHPEAIGSLANVGRYTAGSKVDPNRQFPALGRAFDPIQPIDARGRPIEPENRLLLNLIQQFRPGRIATVHAIREPEMAGIFADPRTDVAGRALGFAPEARLALAMAHRARQGGANVPANHLDSASPNAVYPLDPAVVAAGLPQPRQTDSGVSLGGWAAQAIADIVQPQNSRQALTVITVEVQTALRSADSANPAIRRSELQAHSAAIHKIFLANP